jgi:hypothetical protein
MRQMSHWHAVTAKRPKILKMQKLLNSNMNKYLCNCDIWTRCDSALCDVFDGHLKDGRRNGHILVAVLFSPPLLALRDDHVAKGHGQRRRPRPQRNSDPHRPRPRKGNDGRPRPRPLHTDTFTSAGFVSSSKHFLQFIQC